VILRPPSDASRARGAASGVAERSKRRGAGGTARRLRSAAVDADVVNRRLNLILVLAIVDAVLLVPLVLHRFADLDVPVFPIGMTHGLLFIALVGLCAKGAVEGLWGWWFPAITVITGGPPGSIVGELVIRRRRRPATA
jgi:hypothetical protein